MYQAGCFLPCALQIAAWQAGPLFFYGVVTLDVLYTLS